MQVEYAYKVGENECRVQRGEKVYRVYVSRKCLAIKLTKKNLEFSANKNFIQLEEKV